MDFRERKALGLEIDAEYEPLQIAGGYDHNFVLNNTGEEAELVASLYDKESGRLMEVFTDMPGMQLYCGNFIDGKEVGKKGRVYQQRDGVCFETQFFPNSCNIDKFPSCVLKAGKKFHTETAYKFV